VEVAVIHRPKYDDWSLPKGKLDPGEGSLEAACREVAEETGYGTRPGAELGTVRYPVRTEAGPTAKVVRYWAMEALGGSFAPTAEVDELRWLAPHAALELLTYARDRDVLRRFLAG
jgi:8-oxo-dGTP pyrophosphatase MutT (NUDIX family)